MAKAKTPVKKKKSAIVIQKTEITEFPADVMFLSDDNEVSFIEEYSDKSKGKTAAYKYTKSVTKKGTILPWSLENINKMMSHGMIKIL